MPDDKVYGVKKDCCKVPVNLQRIQLQNDVWCSICRVCACKHWEVSADPLRMGIREY